MRSTDVEIFLKFGLLPVTNANTCQPNSYYYYLRLRNHDYHDILFYSSAIIGRNVNLFKVYLWKFIYAMPAVSSI